MADGKWLIQLEKMRRKMQRHNEKEMPKYITVFYYYISAENEIEKISRQKIRAAPAPTPATTAPHITSGELLRLICERRVLKETQTQTQYYLDELMLFQQEKLTPLPLTIDDIEIKPSLFIFHDVNCIFFIFRRRAASSPAAQTRRTAPKTAQKKYTRKRQL